MRMFIAIEFEEEIKDYLENMQNVIKENSKKGNFTKKENFHITLRFIGEVNKGDIPLLAAAVDEAAVRNKAFNITINQAGAFPKGNTCIAWAGIENSKELSRLYSSLENALEKQGFRRDKKGYTPHITLGREVAINSNPKLFFQKLIVDKKVISVTKISLMESKRIGPNLVYSPVHVSSLK